jgi:hypothetical protein
MPSCPDAWMIYHVPKTGGQTLRNHFRQELGPAAHVHVGRWEILDPLPSVDDVLTGDTTGVRVLTGHAVTRALIDRFPGRKVHEVLVLRDPVERILSHIRYRNWSRAQLGKGPEDFERLLKHIVRRDPMTRWVAGFVGEQRSGYRLDAALYALRGMTVVTVVEHLDRVTPHLLAAVGLPPTVPPRANRTGVEIPAGEALDEAKIEILRRRTQEDQILYHAALGLTERSIHSLAALAPRP